MQMTCIFTVTALDGNQVMEAVTDIVIVTLSTSVPFTPGVFGGGILCNLKRKLYPKGNPNPNPNPNLRATGAFFYVREFLMLCFCFNY